MTKLNLILTSIGLLLTSNISFADESSDYFIRFGIINPKIIDSIDNNPSEPEKPSLKGACKILFSNINKSSSYSTPLHSIEILTKDGVFDFGNVKNSYDFSGTFDNGVVSTNVSSYSNYLPLNAIKPSFYSWKPYHMWGIGYTISFNTPQDLVGIRYMDKMNFSSGDYAYLNYAVSVRGCDNTALFDKVITEYVSPESGQSGTLYFVK